MDIHAKGYLSHLRLSSKVLVLVACLVFISSTLFAVTISNNNYGFYLKMKKPYQGYSGFFLYAPTDQTGSTLLTNFNITKNTTLNVQLIAGIKVQTNSKGIHTINLSFTPFTSTATTSKIGYRYILYRADADTLLSSGTVDRNTSQTNANNIWTTSKSTIVDEEFLICRLAVQNLNAELNQANSGSYNATVTIGMVAP